MKSLNWTVRGLVLAGSLTGIALAAPIACASSSGIDRNQPETLMSSGPIGLDLPGKPVRSLFGIEGHGGESQRSGPLLRQKESGSSALLLERPALIQIWMVNGEWEVRVIPDTGRRGR